MDDLAAIVLAAGSSSRMGALKPLLDLGGRPFLARAVGAFTTVGVDDVNVVTGHRGEEVGAAAAQLGARVVHNPRFEHGQYSSLQAGVADLRTSVTRFFVLPVDCPLVRPETIGRLARAGRALDVDVVIPVCQGEPAHPPLLGTALRAEILAVEPAGGLRELLAAHADRTAIVEVDDRGVLLDADTAADLEQLRRAARGEDLPGEERCRQILNERVASPAVVAHSHAVTAVAATLAMALNEHDGHLCVPLVAAAALLHDVARDEPDHARAGAALVERLGYTRVAALVRRHMDLGAPGDDLGEAEVLYLADKLVLGDRIVTLKERFADRRRGLAGDSPALAAAEGRLRTAVAVQERVEQVLGRRLEAVVGAGIKRS
jgi:molybdenum cofactor cytidylyltransferase